MYAVVTNHSFDADTPVVLFNDDEYDKAKAYLLWLWKSYYTEELVEGSALETSQCSHDDEYARVTWEDGNRTEFVLTSISEPEAGFKDIDWKTINKEGGGSK